MTREIMPSIGAIDIPASGTSMPDESTNVPKLIWTFWHDEKLPDVVRLCVDNWRRFNPDHTIHILNQHNVEQFLLEAELPRHFAQLSAIRKSDWLRLALIAKYGGYWLDASIFLTRPLSWMLTDHKQRGSFVGFYLEGYTSDHRQPVIENWCFAAPAGHSFVTEWCRVFTREVIESSDETFLEKLRASGIYQQVVGKIPTPHYLAAHVAAQYILHQQPARPMHLIKAEDSAYLHHHQTGWKATRLCWAISIKRAPEILAPLIKLRGKERGRLATYLRWNLVFRQSIVGRFLRP